MIVVVAGGRDYAGWDRLCEELDALHASRPIAKLAHGGARGADTMAGAWARSRSVEEVVFPAQWNTFGKNAGPIRNRGMLDDMAPDVLVAFPGGSGTDGCVREARKRGIFVLEVDE